MLLKNCWILKIIDQKESMSEKSATRGRNKPRRIKVFLPDIICLSSCYTEWGTSLPSKKHRHLDFSGLLPENKTESNPGTKKILWNLMLMNVIQPLTTECQNIEYELNSKRLLFQTATKWIDMNNMWTSKILKRNLKHLIHCQYSESQTTRN